MATREAGVAALQAECDAAWNDWMAERSPYDLLAEFQTRMRYLNARIRLTRIQGPGRDGTIEHMQEQIAELRGHIIAIDGLSLHRHGEFSRRRTMV